MSQVELVRAARGGDPVAIDQLVRAWLPAVLGWCSRLGGPAIHPEDAAHDVFVVVLDRLSQLRDEERFAAWLFHFAVRPTAIADALP